MTHTTPGPRPDQVPEEALDFTADEDSLTAGEPSVQQAERPPLDPQDQPGLTGAATQSESAHEDHVSLDDLSPDTLFDESGARSPHEPGGSGPADEALRSVEENEIGGGSGLDEAELGRSAPLDGKPWADEVSPAAKERER